MKRFKIVLSKKAEKDIENIYSYISDTFSEQDAIIVITKIYKKIMLLDVFPERTEPFEKDKNGQDLRATISGRYRVIYVVEKSKSKVFIARILHVGQDLKGII